MVGADGHTFARIEPYLRCFATDVLHCGPIGCGQVVKLMNNMVLFEIVGAIAEALAIGRHSGVEPEALLEALSKGSADSFALRNHAETMRRTAIRAGVLDRYAWGSRIRPGPRRAGRHRCARRAS
jgi:3-hydroxyisobutyrate dehydrogenase-like beta-hydroxyacid dehydrogenase